MAVVVLVLSTIKVEDWSMFDWISAICTAVLLYCAGIPLGVMVDSLSRPTTRPASLQAASVDFS